MLSVCQYLRGRSIFRHAAAGAVALAGWAGVGGLVPQAQAGNPPATPTATDPNRFAVTGGEVARRLFHLADTRRIDFAIIGDSNVRNSGISGHEDGMSRALSARFGSYATRVDPYIGTNSWGAPVTGESAFGYLPFQLIGTAGVPAEAMQYAFPTNWFPNSFGYLPAGAALPSSYNGGLGLQPDCILDLNGAMRYHLTHYRWRTPTNGELVLSARWPSYNNFAEATFRTAAITPGLTDASLDIPPGDRATTGLIIAPSNLVLGRGTKGPFFGLWQRVESPNRATGVAYSTLLYQGGKSARSACIELNNIGPNSPALREWMRQIVRLQNADPVLCVHIMHGGNDAGDTDPSVGPLGGLRSDSALGHADNLRGIMNNLRAAWAGLGYSPDNLFFILGPYHPRGDRLPVEQSYEQQWVFLAQSNPNTIAMRGTMLSTEAEFVSMGWVLSAIDYAHLSIAGYHAWGRTTVEALQRAACPADLNHDRACTIEDVFQYLTAYFTGAPAADFDGNQANTLDDLFAFLSAWFMGC
jgi:hypothetical protein